MLGVDPDLSGSPARLRPDRGETYGWLRPDETFVVGAWEWPLSGVSPIAFAFLFSAVVLGVFLLIERHAVQPLVDVGLFRIPQLLRRKRRRADRRARGVRPGVLHPPVPAERARALGVEAGAALAVTAVGALVAGGAAATRSKRIGPAGGRPPRARALEAVGLALYAVLVGPDISAWRLTPALFLYGFGVGLATAQLTSVILADIPKERSGQGVRHTVDLASVGSALGIAILGATLASRLCLPVGGSGRRRRGSACSRQAATHLRRRRGLGRTAIPAISAQAPPAVGEALREAGAAATKVTAFVAAGFVLSASRRRSSCRTSATRISESRVGRDTRHPRSGCPASRTLVAQSATLSLSYSMVRPHTAGTIAPSACSPLTR